MPPPSLAYLLAHQILPGEWTSTRFPFAIAEWDRDPHAYLHGRAIRAQLEGLRHNSPSSLPELLPTTVSWPDGMRALIISFSGPYEQGEALHCGVFWTPGDFRKYLILEQGAGRTILASRPNPSTHLNHGQAQAATAQEFSELGRQHLLSPPAE